MAEPDNATPKIENAPVKKKRGRPVGSKNQINPFKRKAEEILRRSLTHSLETLASRKKNNLEDMNVPYVFVPKVYVHVLTTSRFSISFLRSP